MSITPYDRLFQPRSLSGLVEVFAREDAMSRTALSLFEGSARRIDPVVDGSFEWDETQFSRHLAPSVGRGGPAPIATPVTQVVRNSAPAHIKNSKRIPAYKLHGDRGPGSLLPNAQAVIDQEMRDLVKVIGNTKEYLAMRTLFGSVVVNSSTVPGTTVPFTLTFSNNTYTASTTWAAASTSILGVEVPAAKIDFMQAIGLVPARVITGATVAGYLGSNSEIINLLAPQNGAMLARSAGQMFSAAAFEGLQIGQLLWQITEEGYVPEGGSFTRYVPATDKAVMLPGDGDLMDVLGMAEGYGLVPAYGGDVVPVAGAEFAVDKAPSRGMWSYAVRHTNPLEIELISGWCGLTVLLTPNGVCVLDVVP